MHDPAPSRLLIVLTSNSDRKTLRSLTSLMGCLSMTENRHRWQITILRPPPYNNSPLLLPPAMMTQLQNLNVRFLQPQIRLSTATAAPFHEFLFCTHNGSYSTAAQRNRGLLAVNDVLQSTTVDLIAVLDDDLVFQNALLRRNQHGRMCVTFETTHDYLSGLETIYALAKSGPIIGGCSGCPPIPGILALRGAIEDMNNDATNISPTDLVAAQDADYYYDFRDNRDTCHSRGAWFTYCYNNEYTTPSLTNILFGVTPTRPLLFNSDALLRTLLPSTRRGGNTYFANAHDLLSIPHVTLCVDGLSTRRSDMIVAELAKHKGITYRETYFPLGHLRIVETAPVNSAGMLNCIEAELFGVSLHRGITSFVASGDYIKAWKDVFAHRLACVTQTRLCVDRALVCSDGKQELGELAVIFNHPRIEDRLVQREKGFFAKYTEVVDQYCEIDHYWTGLVEKHSYEVDY